MYNSLYQIFRCARSSIPNMEKVNENIQVRQKNSKTIIYMRGGMLSFCTNKAKNERKKSNSKYTKFFFTNFIQMDYIKSTQNELW